MPPEVLPRVHVEPVTTAPAWSSLEPEWNRLWRRCPDATPFQSPVWGTTWWRIFGAGGLLRTLTVGRALVLRGVARLYALRTAGRVVGVYYGFLDRGRAYYYLGGFDPAYHAYGIGNQLVAHAIAEARREGAGTFDFLRGREPYKYRWGAVDQTTLCIRANSGLLSGSAPLFEPRAGTEASVAHSLP